MDIKFYFLVTEKKPKIITKMLTDRNIKNIILTKNNFE